MSPVRDFFSTRESFVRTHALGESPCRIDSTRAVIIALSCPTHEEPNTTQTTAIKVRFNIRTLGLGGRLRSLNHPYWLTTRNLLTVQSPASSRLKVRSTRATSPVISCWSSSLLSPLKVGVRSAVHSPHVGGDESPCELLKQTCSSPASSRSTRVVTLPPPSE